MNEKNQIGLSISESEYRDLPYPSYSMLSDIAKIGGANVIGAERNKNINELDGVMVGKLVDNLLTENKLPDNFYIVKKKPTGKAKDLIKLLVANKKYLPNKENILHKDNYDLINTCCDKLSYHTVPKKTEKERFEKRIAAFKNYEEYINILIKAPEDSFVISEYLYYQATKTVDILRKKYNLIFDKPELANLRVIPQVKLLGEYNKTKIKGMLDFVVIDDERKTLTPYDLKTGSYNSNDFFEKGYLGWNYYIQSSLYLELLRKELNSHPIYKDYKITDFVFIFCGRLDGSVDHLIVSPRMHENALNGFEINNITYKGVTELCLEFEHYNKK